MSHSTKSGFSFRRPDGRGEPGAIGERSLPSLIVVAGGREVGKIVSACSLNWPRLCPDCDDPFWSLGLGVPQSFSETKSRASFLKSLPPLLSRAVVPRSIAVVGVAQVRVAPVRLSVAPG